MTLSFELTANHLPALPARSIVLDGSTLTLEDVQAVSAGRSGPLAIKAVHALIRKQVPTVEDDRAMEADIGAVLALIRSGTLTGQEGQ